MGVGSVLDFWGFEKVGPHGSFNELFVISVSQRASGS